MIIQQSQDQSVIQTFYRLQAYIRKLDIPREEQTRIILRLSHNPPHILGSPLFYVGRWWAIDISIMCRSLPMTFTPLLEQFSLRRFPAPTLVN